MIVIREAEKTVPVYTYVQHEITGVVQDNNGKPIAGLLCRLKEQAIVPRRMLVADLN
ncbi:hypothetical protein KUH03_11440 [Sphingobacterium sp. E70]|uniref:hypothetical protein n=1 Tax=Sphingobacterium sp. E70 TaxID=2853439 RepID=UPI00211C0E0E|nr:hypothetical protein [Sphingobacterium sp. E70]ULT27312.1 hypothetical protein KUH03_11440 [Sphingobacterium sp. E70]